MTVIRVLVADDDELFRAALVDVLGADPRFVVVADLPSGEGIVEVARDHAADLVLVDVRMPAGGATAAEALRVASASGRLGPVRVVALSAQASTATVVGLLRAGAVGYLVKGQRASDLPDLVLRCAHGQVVVTAPTGASALRQLVQGS